MAINQFLHRVHARGRDWLLSRRELPVDCLQEIAGVTFLFASLSVAGACKSVAKWPVTSSPPAMAFGPLGSTGIAGPAIFRFLPGFCGTPPPD